MIRAIAFGLAAMAVGPAQAEIRLQPPVSCEIGANCFIQNHVDRDTGPGVQDFACGSLSYDGHNGTDFAVATLAEMKEGVAVLAPAAGTVTGIRDGMPDIAFNAPNAPSLDGRDCGNGVAIDHGQGWTTQLCHLKLGSVRVKPGDRVEVGQSLGLIGLSGRTEFPHVHMTLRKDGAVVDPFRPEDATGCAIEQGSGLWAEPIPYVAGTLTAVGIAPAPPDYAQVLAGLVTPDPLPQRSEALVIWALMLGPRVGDTLTLRLTGPRGEVISEDIQIERTQARAFRFVGRKLRGDGWPAGEYLGSITMLRKDTVLSRAEVQTRIAP
jgi:hypothetical protein